MKTKFIKRKQMFSFFFSILILIQLHNLFASVDLYSNLSRCGNQSNNQVVILNNNQYAIIYACEGMKSSGGYAVCIDVKNEIDNSFVLSTYLSPNDNQQHSIIASDNLSKGNFVVVYSDSSQRLLFFFIADSTMTKIFSDTRVSTINNFSQITPKVTSILYGKFVIVWAHDSFDGSGWGIVAKMCLEDGTVYKNEFVVNTYIPNNQNNPSICAMPNGNFVISWDSYFQDGYYNNSVFMQIFSNNGEKIGSEIAVTFDSRNYHEGQPSAACLSNGNIVVAFTNYDERDGQSYGIFATLFNSNGNQIGNQIRVNSNGSSVQSRPFAYPLNDGKFVILWESYLSSYDYDSDTSGYGIYMQRYDSNKNQIGTNYQINILTPGNQYSAKIALLKNRGYLISWITDAYTSCNSINYSRIMYNIYDLDRLVNNNFYYNQINPSIAASPSGNFFIVWQNYNYQKSNFDIYGKIYDKNKNVIKSDFIVNNNFSAGNLILPKVTMLNNNLNFVVVFILVRHSWIYTNDSFISAIYSVDGTAINFNTRIFDLTEHYDNDFQLISFSTNQFIIIWASHPPSIYNSETYFIIFNSNFTETRSKTRINKNYYSNDQRFPTMTVIQLNSVSYRFAAAYTSNSNSPEPSPDNTSYAVMGIIFNSDFTVYKSDFLINTYTPSTQKNAKIVGLSNSNFVVFYDSYSIINQGYEVVGQLFDYNGNKIGIEVIINKYRLNNQNISQVFTTTDSIFAVWSGETEIDRSSTGIGVTVLDFDLKLKKEFYPNKISYLKQSNPSLVKLANSNQIIAIWTANDSGDAKGGSIIMEIFDECPLNYFPDPNDFNRCMPCDFSCLGGCSLSSDNCISCKQGTLKKFDDLNKCYFYPAFNYYLDSINNIYKKCDISCAICINSEKNCQICAPNYYPFVDNSSNCILSNLAPDGYFFSAPNKLIDKCDISCETCVTTAINCKICSKNYYPLVNATNTCRISAPNGYYFDVLTNIHQLCDVSCVNCLTSAKNCIGCAVNYYPLEDKINTCSNVQITGYYFSLNKYLLCDVSCKSCNVPGKYCTECATNYFPLETNINDCRNNSNFPVGTYLELSINKYRICDISCYSCIDTPMNCIQCARDYFPLEDKLNTCIIKNINLNWFSAQFNQGYYFNTPHSKYMLCDDSCINCVNSKDYCLSCKIVKNYYPLIDNRNSCKSSAPIGYYFNTVSRLYEFCDISCYTCVNSPAYCTECKTANKYYKLDDKNDVCKNYPPDGYYFETAVQWYKRCDVSCYTCVDNPKKCLKCSTGYYFLEDVPNSCMNYALPNYYFNAQFSLYKRCGITCELCIERDNKCLKCNYKDKYFPLVDDSTRCYKECPDYYWKNFIKSECSFCHKSCKKCSDDTPVCQACAAKYLPKSDNLSSCSDIVPNETYTLDLVNNNWYKCPIPGFICYDNKKFKVCADGYFLIRLTSDCVKSCPDGFWEDTKIKECIKCTPPCSKCKDDKICKSCIKDFYLHSVLLDNNCISICPDNFYADKASGSCKACKPACKSCDSDKICNSCNKGNFYMKEMRDCLSKCPDGYYTPDGSDICNLCGKLCKTCISKADECLSCIKSFFLESKTKSCVAKCTDGSYAELSDNTCQNCDQSCLTCKGKSESDCLSCVQKPSIKFIKGYCTDKCPGNMIKRKNSDDCIDINGCFDSLIFTIPKMFNIQINNYKATLIYKLKTNCADLSSDIKINWIPFPDAFISVDKSTLEIPVDKLKDGNISLTVELYYNLSLIKSFTGSSFLIINKLIPVIKNEADLGFIYGFDIEIDGSLSYDEGSLRSTSKDQEPLNFTWQCPVNFKTLCDTLKSSNIKFSSSDYTSIVPIPKENLILEFKLILKKDRRIGIKSFNLILKKPLPAVQNGPIDLTELIVIIPLSRGGSPELLIGVSFIDKNLNILDYKYFWSILHFLKDEQYLNGRNEPNLKVLNEDLLTGFNDFVLVLTDKGGNNFTKNYSYEKPRAPYGGNCVVSPMIGVSMKTNMKFTTSGWISKSEPFIYKIKYLNSNKIYVDISKGGFPDSSWSTNMIPIAKEFVIEVTDSSGLSSLTPCSIKIMPNPELLSLDSYLEGEFDSNNRLLIVEIYKSNKDNLDSEQKDSSLNNKALDMMGYYLKNSSENISQDLENIIARILSISNEQFDKDKLIIINNSIKLILENIEPLLQYIDKMQNVYRILDNIFKKASTMEEFKSDKQLLDILQDYLNQLNAKLFTNIVNGQKLLIANDNYNTQMNKVSKLNVPTLAIDYDSDSKRRSNYKKTKIRYMQNSIKNQDCSDSTAAICIPPNNITSIIANTGSNGIGFQGQLNHKDNLPIQESQFSNSLNFELSTEENNGKSRKLDESNLNIRFELRLKMPIINDKNVNQNNENNTVQDATCVQYTEKKPDTSCDSWYDTDSNEVICSCIKQGLTVNVLDKALSNMSKIKQFPSLNTDLLNPYSIGIISAFLILLIVVFSIGSYKDSKDHKSLVYMNCSEYDMMQHYIIKFRKEGFEEKITFFKLFCYIVKKMHPIFSIFNIYDPIYNRKIRTMDFFFSIYLTFFFTLLPFNVTDNSQLVDMMANRTIQSRYKKDLEVVIKQIVQSAIYSVFASIATVIITTLLSLFLYENILLKESDKRKKLMFEALMRIHSDIKPSHKIKSRNAIFKLRTILIIIDSYLKKLRNPNNQLNINNDIPKIESLEEKEMIIINKEKDCGKFASGTTIKTSITVGNKFKKDIGREKNQEFSNLEIDLLQENKVSNIHNFHKSYSTAKSGKTRKTILDNYNVAKKTSFDFLRDSLNNPSIIKTNLYSSNIRKKFSEDLLNKKDREEYESLRFKEIKKNQYEEKPQNYISAGKAISEENIEEEFKLETEIDLKTNYNEEKKFKTEIISFKEEFASKKQDNYNYLYLELKKSRNEEFMISNQLESKNIQIHSVEKNILNYCSENNKKIFECSKVQDNLKNENNKQFQDYETIISPKISLLGISLHEENNNFPRENDKSEKLYKHSRKISDELPKTNFNIHSVVRNIIKDQLKNDKKIIEDYSESKEKEIMKFYFNDSKIENNNSNDIKFEILNKNNFRLNKSFNNNLSQNIENESSLNIININKNNNRNKFLKSRTKLNDISNIKSISSRKLISSNLSVSPISPFVNSKLIQEESSKICFINQDFISNSNTKKIFNIKKLSSKFEKSEITRFISKNKEDISDLALLETTKKINDKEFEIVKNLKFYNNNNFPLIVENQNKEQLEHSISLQENIFLKYDLSIHHEIEIFFKGKKEIIVNSQKMIVIHSTRSYTFPCKDPSRFSCQKISFTKASKIDYFKNFLKGYTKIILIGTLTLILWLYIAVFVKSIYKQYGNGIFKICVMPLISMLFVKLVIIMNIMFLIATIILYFKGKEFINTAKKNLLMIVFFKALVPPLALNHFTAIVTYQNFIEIKKKYLTK